jgi:hypothetical protein
MSPAEGSIESCGWRKSRHSMANGNCVEVRSTDNFVAVRDSMNPNGNKLAFGAQTWGMFTAAAREGRFDAI